jgi:hypothetical protein
MSWYKARLLLCWHVLCRSALHFMFVWHRVFPVHLVEQQGNLNSTGNFGALFPAASKSPPLLRRLITVAPCSWVLQSFVILRKRSVCPQVYRLRLSAGFLPACQPTLY